MKGLSVRAPWWYAILHLGKPVENRDWYTNVRGTIYLQASKWWKADEVAETLGRDVPYMWQRANPDLPLPAMPDLAQMKSAAGCLVGKVDVVGCVMGHPSPWFVGKYGFVLANPAVFARPIPFKGALGFFEVPDGIEDWDMPAMSEGVTRPTIEPLDDPLWAGNAPLFTGFDLSVSRDLAGTQPVVEKAATYACTEQFMGKERK